MKKHLIILTVSIFTISCGGNDINEQNEQNKQNLTTKDVEQFIYHSEYYDAGYVYLDFNAGGVVKKCQKTNKEDFGTDYETGTWKVDSGRIVISNVGRVGGVYIPKSDRYGKIGRYLQNVDSTKGDLSAVDSW
jgi:hypothetical protein